MYIIHLRLSLSHLKMVNHLFLIVTFILPPSVNAGPILSLVASEVSARLAPSGRSLRSVSPCGSGGGDVSHRAWDWKNISSSKTFSKKSWDQILGIIYPFKIWCIYIIIYIHIDIDAVFRIIPKNCEHVTISSVEGLEPVPIWGRVGFPKIGDQVVVFLHRIYRSTGFNQFEKCITAPAIPWPIDEHSQWSHIHILLVANNPH